MENLLLTKRKILRQKLRGLNISDIPVPDDDRLDKLICDLYELDAYLHSVFQTYFETNEKRNIITGCFNEIKSDLDTIDFKSHELDQIVSYIQQLKEVADIYSSL